MNIYLQNLTLLTLTFFATAPLHAMEPANPASQAAHHLAMGLHDVDEKENENTILQEDHETSEALGKQLIAALRKKDVASAQTLIAQKADVSYSYPFGKSDEKHAIMFNENIENGRWGGKTTIEGTSYPPLMLAMVCSDPETPQLIQQLINAKVDVNASSMNRLTPLNLLYHRSLDSTFDNAQNHALAHVLVCAGARRYIRRRDFRYNSYNAFKSMIETAWQNRANLITLRLLLRNPGLLSHNHSSLALDPLCVNTPTQDPASPCKYLLPTTIITHINSFITEARFTPRAIATAELASNAAAAQPDIENPNT